MAYLQAHIDRAIVMTQFDLRGFGHPLGVRMNTRTSAKGVWYATINLPAFIAGVGREDHEIDPTYIPALQDGNDTSTYEDHVKMAKAMAEACDGSQVEAIDYLLRNMAARMSRFRSLRDTATFKGNAAYIGELDPETTWGRTYLSMREGFAEQFMEVRKHAPK